MLNSYKNIISILLMILSVFLANIIFAEKYIVKQGPVNQSMSGGLGNIGDDNIVHWGSTSVTWYLNGNGAGDGLTFTQTKNAVQASFDSWEDVSTSAVDFSYIGSTTSEWSIDNKNTHFWAESGDAIFDPPYNLPSYVLAVTVITINSDEEFTDVDIVLNGRNWTWKFDGNDYDIQAVSTHEIGHMCGLHHTEVSGPPVPTMRSGYNGTAERSLEFDDETGISFLYTGNLIDNETLSGTDYFRWDLNVYSGIILTVQSGSTLKFNNGKKLTINGKLVSQGSASDVITFTSSNSEPSSGDWYGIRFNNSSNDNSTIEYCNIEYAQVGIRFYSASPTVKHSTISQTSSYGLYLYYSDPTIKHSTIDQASSYGMYLYHSDPFLKGNTIQNGAREGIYMSLSSPRLIENNITGNGDDGIYAYRSSPQFGEGSRASYGYNGYNVVTANSGVGISAQVYTDARLGALYEGGSCVECHTGGNNSIYSNSADCQTCHLG